MLMLIYNTQTVLNIEPYLLDPIVYLGLQGLPPKYQIVLF